MLGVHPEFFNRYIQALRQTSKFHEQLSLLDREQIQQVRSILWRYNIDGNKSDYDTLYEKELSTEQAAQAIAEIDTYLCKKDIIDQIRMGNGVRSQTGFSKVLPVPAAKQYELHQFRLDRELFKAVIDHDIDRMQTLVAAGVRINSKINSENIDFAMLQGIWRQEFDIEKNIEIIKYLIEYDVNPCRAIDCAFDTAINLYKDRNSDLNSYNDTNVLKKLELLLKFGFQSSYLQDIKFEKLQLSNIDPTFWNDKDLALVTVFLNGLSYKTTLSNNPLYDQLVNLGIEYVQLLYNRYEQIAVKSTTEERITRLLEQGIDYHSRRVSR